MSYWRCVTCNRSFKSEHSLQQHLDSPAHVFECELCDRSFKSEHSLQQHLDSPAHVFECELCDRSFKSEHSLQQHLNSPAHVFECELCDRSFKSEHSLQQHLNSPAHVFECALCGRSFGSEHSLQQHRQSHVNKILQNVQQALISGLSNHNYALSNNSGTGTLNSGLKSEDAMVEDTEGSSTNFELAYRLKVRSLLDSLFHALVVNWSTVMLEDTHTVLLTICFRRKVSNLFVFASSNKPIAIFLF
jgi:uncharacterized C2H2 Zn-finger protein